MTGVWVTHYEAGFNIYLFSRNCPIALIDISFLQRRERHTFTWTSINRCAYPDTMSDRL